MSPDDLAAAMVRLPWERNPGEVAAEWRHHRMMVRLPPLFSAAWQRRIIPEVYRGANMHRGSTWPMGILVESPGKLLASRSPSVLPDPQGQTTLTPIHLVVREWRERRDGLQWEIRESSLEDGRAILDWEREALEIDWADD